MHAIRTFTKITGATFVALALTVPTANAAVTFDPATGTGFVGKGDVQTVMGWNNKQLQANAQNVSFSYSQDATQALSQSAAQTASQASTQSVLREVSCDTLEGKQNFYREGVRAGAREATREGSREGSRTGTLSGVISSALDGDPRQTKGQNQFTGFILKGYVGTPVFSASGEPVYADPTFGEWSFGQWVGGDIEWGGWKTTGLGTGSPADCVNGGDGDFNIVDDTTVGDVVEGDVVEGAIEYGTVTEGDVTRSGTAHVFATHAGVTRQLN